MPPEPGPGIPPAHGQAIAELSRIYAWELSGGPEHVPESVSNTNYRVETGAGPRFIRAHSASLTRERIEREHRVMVWAGERGIPVASPLADGASRTVHAIGGVLWSVFPWLEGRSLHRGTMTAREAGLLGAMNGRLQRVLADWPPGDLHRNSELSWDTERSIADLSRVDDLIRYYPAQTEEQLRVQGWIRAQMEMLERGAARPAADFEEIPVQPCHGDPHERNLMVDAAGEPMAVVDWERFCLNPPAFEVLRTLTFARLLDEPLITAFLAGYRTENRLAAETIAPCVEFWWQSELNNTWVYRDRFIKGNLAVEQFFEEGAAALRRFSDAGYRASLAGRLRREAS